MRTQSLPAKAVTTAETARRSTNQAETKADVARSMSMPTFAQPIAASANSGASSPSAHHANAASHPVHSMQSEILRAGLAGGPSSSQSETMVCPPGQRGYSNVEDLMFDSSMVENVGSAIRDMSISEAPRQRMHMQPLPPQFQPEPKKSGGFSVFGITIGGSSTSKRASISRPAVPSAARLGPAHTNSGELSRSLPQSSKAPMSPKDKSEDVFNSVGDDQLEIPAFLRRQVN